MVHGCQERTMGNRQGKEIHVRDLATLFQLMPMQPVRVKETYIIGDESVGGLPHQELEPSRNVRGRECGWSVSWPTHDTNSSVLYHWTGHPVALIMHGEPAHCTHVVQVVPICLLYTSPSPRDRTRSR